MAEKQEEVLEQPVEETKVEEPKAEETNKDTGFQEDGTYKADFSNPPKPVEEQETTEEKVEEQAVEEVKQEVEETAVLQEITDEEEQPEPVEETGEEDVMSKLEPLIKLTFVIWSCDVKVTFSNFEILSNSCSPTYKS